MPTTKLSTKRSWLGRNNQRIASGFDRILLYEFDVLNAHQTFAAKSLLRKQKALESEIEKMTANMCNEEQSGYIDHMHDEYVTATESLPRMQWYAQFLIVYSTFEHMLHELCRIVQSRSDFSLSFKDLEGAGITRARNYLVKVAGVEAPFQTAAWNRTLLLAEIRNAIAHRNGEIDYQPKNKKALSTKLKNEKHLVLKQIIAEQEDAQIILNAEFVRQSIESLREVIVDICNFELYKNKS